MYRPYRRIVQIGVFAVMFLIPVLNLYEIYAVTGTFYAINIGGLGIADPVVIFQAVFASGELTIPLLTAAIFPVFLALLLGRVWCGWMCPYHLLADAAAWLRGALVPRVLGRELDQKLALPVALPANICRFGFLIAGTVIAGAIGIPVLNYVNAPAITSTEAMIFVKERSLSLEFGFIALLMLLEVSFLPRFWCRLFCPTGALVSLFRTRFTLHVGTDIKTPKAPCCKENLCSQACPMGLKPFREGRDLLCTNCARCIDACRSGSLHGRLRFKGFSVQG
ncbi:MAG: 4Fe-4S binding protein [Desulfomonile tiedjei]|nr:4Fe-4S binding protein [Desulfomonile tiedjei]